MLNFKEWLLAEAQPQPQQSFGPPPPAQAANKRINWSPEQMAAFLAQHNPQQAQEYLKHARERQAQAQAKFQAADTLIPQKPEPVKQEPVKVVQPAMKLDYRPGAALPTDPDHRLIVLTNQLMQKNQALGQWMYKLAANKANSEKLRKYAGQLNSVEDMERLVKTLQSRRNAQADTVVTQPQANDPDKTYRSWS